MTMTHAERKLRRERIARHAEKHGRTSAAQKFGVSTCTVRISCAEHGITFPRPLSHPMSASTFDIIAALLKGESQTDIARSHNLTRQRISQIHGEMKRAGIYKECEK